MAEYLCKMTVKMDDIISYGYCALRQYPKSERFILVTMTANCMWELSALIQSAVDATDKRRKLAYMEQADKELKKLKSMVRNAMNLKFLPFGKYEYLSGLLVELGRMIGAWQHQISQHRD